MSSAVERVIAEFDALCNAGDSPAVQHTIADARREIRRLQDCELMLRLSEDLNGPIHAWANLHDGAARLFFADEVCIDVPMVNGVPTLTDEARAALEKQA